MDKYKCNVGFAAGSMMIKWNILNTYLTDIKPNESLNVFINFESIIKNICNIRNFNISFNYFKQQFILDLESSILNLVANYKSYFIKQGAIPFIYLYYTDLESNEQLMRIINKYYRNYYFNKYRQNPQYKNIYEIMKIVIPEIELLLSYVPNCYFIKAINFDGSLIPLIISNSNDYKNIIISEDVFDTLYMFERFKVIYIRRKYPHTYILTDPIDVINTIVKNADPLSLSIFSTELYYKVFMAIKGSKIRNIQSSKSFGYTKFIDIINDALKVGNILEEYKSIESILNIFPNQYRENIKRSFISCDLEKQLSLIGVQDRELVLSQIVEKYDNESIEALNNQRFLEFPVNISGLLK